MDSELKDFLMELYLLHGEREFDYFVLAYPIRYEALGADYLADTRDREPTKLTQTALKLIKENK